jgi:hypothetical protein
MQDEREEEVDDGAAVGVMAEQQQPPPRKSEATKLAERKAEAQREQLERKAAEAQQAAQAYRAHNEQPLRWVLQPPDPGDARPGLTLRVWGGGLIPQSREKERQERLADEAAAALAVRECRESGEQPQLLRRLVQLINDTQARLAEARGELAKHQTTVGKLLAAGEEPSKAERAARDARLQVETLEARLPVLTPQLESARRRAELAEQQARNDVLSQRREARKQATLAREAAITSKLEAVLREMLGLESVAQEG